MITTGLACADQKKNSEMGGGGSNSDNDFFLFSCFLVDEGRYDANTTISGSSSARQRNANTWRFAGGP